MKHKKHFERFYHLVDNIIRSASDGVCCGRNPSGCKPKDPGVGGRAPHAWPSLNHRYLPRLCGGDSIIIGGESYLQLWSTNHPGAKRKVAGGENDQTLTHNPKGGEFALRM